MTTLPFACAWSALRRNTFTLACTALLSVLSARTIAALSRPSTALRRHPFSVTCTAVLLTVSAALLGVSAPLALLVWGLASLISLETWHALEPFALVRLGCRPPSHVERERLAQVLGPEPL